MPKLYIKTYGCQMNERDSEQVARMFVQKGYTMTDREDEADVILFLVEVNTGITDLDQMMADILRRTSKKVLLVCNKVDNYDLIYSSHEFYSLGLGEPY